MSQLGQWDGKERERLLIEEEREVRMWVLEVFKKWADLKQISWRQKSRELWLKEGDKNTNFFHKMTNARRRRNFIAKIRVNDELLTEEDGIKEGVASAFCRILSESGEWRLTIGIPTFDSLPSDDAEGLETPFSEEEVLVGLFDLCGDKALGMDGFIMAFWKFCWDFVKREVMGFFAEFHDVGSFERSLNTMFIVLVPKKGGAYDLKDFRPISLVGGLYKLLAKVLANKLKKVVDKFVSNFQHAFVVGRQILDAFSIENEAIDSRIKGKLKEVICKLDIKKAYDHVNWNFVLALLEKMGFGFKGIGWIRWCIFTVRSSILVNGSPFGFFQSSRGLRQGDPMSPYLFILAMEAFSCILIRAKEEGFFEGFLDEVEALFMRLQVQTSNRDIEDKMIWLNSKSYIFLS